MAIPVIKIHTKIGSHSISKNKQNESQNSNIIKKILCNFFKKCVFIILHSVFHKLRGVLIDNLDIKFRTKYGFIDAGVMVHHQAMLLRTKIVKLCLFEQSNGWLL